MSDSAPRSTVGTDIVWRSVWSDERVVGTAWASRVVIDSDDLIVLYRPPGTPGKRRTGVFGGPRDRLLIQWDGGYKDIIWERAGLLIVYRPGDMYSVWRAWDPQTWSLMWRYINLEEAWRRTPIGFDSKDLYLDLWCKPDETEWHWKDEDEALWAADNGKLTASQFAAARAAGEEAVRSIGAGEPPYDRDWDAWRPDPTWSTPVLPEDWRDHEPRRR